MLKVDKENLYLGVFTPLGIFIEEKIQSLVNGSSFLKVFCGSKKIVYTAELNSEKDLVKIYKIEKNKLKTKLGTFGYNENIIHRAKYKNHLLYILESIKTNYKQIDPKDDPYSFNECSFQEDLMIIVPEYENAILKVCIKSGLRIKGYLPISRELIYLLVKDENGLMSIILYKVEWEKIETTLESYERSTEMKTRYDQDVEGGRKFQTEQKKDRESTLLKSGGPLTEKNFAFDSAAKENLFNLPNMPQTDPVSSESPQQQKDQLDSLLTFKNSKLSLKKKNPPTLKMPSTEGTNNTLRHSSEANAHQGFVMELKPPKKTMTQSQAAKLPSSYEDQNIFEIGCKPIKSYKFVPPSTLTCQSPRYSFYFMDFTSSSEFLLCVLQSRVQDSSPKPSSFGSSFFKTEMFIFEVTPSRGEIFGANGLKGSSRSSRSSKGLKKKGRLNHPELTLLDSVCRVKGSKVVEASSKLTIREYSAFLLLYRDLWMEMWVIVDGNLVKFSEQNLGCFFSIGSSDSFFTGFVKDSKIVLNKKKGKLYLSSWNQEVCLSLKKSENAEGEWQERDPMTYYR
jgi:hypothetical protein